jgi:hypothetical protein
MALKPMCDMCAKELKQYGAILLSPPDKKSKVIKYHICPDCYKEIVKKNTISVKNSYKE